MQQNEFADLEKYFFAVWSRYVYAQWEQVLDVNNIHLVEQRE